LAPSPFFFSAFAPLRSVGNFGGNFACAVKYVTKAKTNKMHTAMAANCHGSHTTAATPTANPSNKTRPLNTLGFLIKGCAKRGFSDLDATLVLLMLQYLQYVCRNRGNRNTRHAPQKNIDELGDNGLWFNSGLADIK
jgi:hypothetical protein